MGRQKHVEGTCEICGCEYMAYCSYYRDHDWVDGRRHKELCHACFDVPKVHVMDERTGIWFVMPLDPDRLYTPKEMMDDGWDKDIATRSVKAVKAAIKNGKSRSK